MTTNRLFIKLAGLAIALCTLGITNSCSDDNEPARTPRAEVIVDKQSLEINESMQVHFTGVADQVVIFTGDKDHDYELRNQSNTGFAVNKGLFTYSYRTPGTFHVVCVASTYDTYLGGSLQTDTYSFDVTVTDNVTNIDNISTTITPNVYYASRLTDDEWLLCLPTKQLYNNREMTVNAARQRLGITIGSDSAKIYIDGEPYSSRAYYALNTDHSIRVVSPSGSTRDYSLYGMIYPEFSTITVGGKEVKLTRSAFYQDLQTYAVDSDNLTLDYTVGDDVQLLDGTQPLLPGSLIQLDKEYTLRRYHPGNPQVMADARILFQR